MSVPPPQKQASSLTTVSESDHEDDAATVHDEPWFFRILDNAAAFGEVIADHPSSSAGEKEPAEGADVVGLLGRDLARLEIQEPTQANLGGAPKRWVNVCASSWLKRRTHSGLAGSSESDEETDSDRGKPEDDDERPMPEDKLSDEPDSFTASPSTISPSTTPPTEAAPLTPSDKVALIVSEFGALTHGEEVEELLAETDAAFFQDVVILGVLHLTTHRITFHASLLSTRPDLAPAKEVLHAGPAVVVKGKGLRRRHRRVWLELTHDMISSFRSSEENERVRPLRTILLSAFRKIHPVDPDHPRLVRFEFSCAKVSNSADAKRYPACGLAHSRSRISTHKTSRRKSDKVAPDNDGHDVSQATAGVTESVIFDTEEAAMGWRREVQAALYMSRRQRRNVLTPSSDADADTDDGVRISIPLTRIQALSTHTWDNVASILQLDLGDGPPVEGMELKTVNTRKPWDAEVLTDEGPLSQGWTPPTPDAAPRRVASGFELDPEKLQFGLLRWDEAWENLDEIVTGAKERPPLPEERGVVVDFGMLTFVEDGLDAFDAQNRASVRADVMQGSKERVVRRVFGLGGDVDIWITKCSLNRTISTSGLLVLSAKFVCFWSHLVATSDVKLRFHTADVRVAAPARVWYRGAGLTLRVRGHPDMLFEFSTKGPRDEALRRLGALVPRPHSLARTLATASPPPGSRSLPPGADTPTALLSPTSRAVAHLRHHTFPPALLPYLAKPINVPDIPYGVSPRHFVCLTIGSRGDVQPYIALGRGLQAAGHRVTIVTHAEYKPWIEGWGITHRTAGGDPGALMKLSVEHKMFSPQFFRESIGHFRTWIDQLLLEAWEQCKDAEVLIESPPAMAGVHIAEALNIPYFRAFTMPWSKTAQYPHPFISPPVEGSASFNTASYVLFDNVFWLGTSGQINRWRKKHLGLESTDMGHLAQAKIAFLYNFSPSVVPKPMDWGDQIIISGYWFLDNPDLGWVPAPSLLTFIAQARTEGKPLVYIGFGSITVPHARAMTRSIVKAVIKSDVRAILSKGWSSRMDKDDGPEMEVPPQIYMIDKAPHDWLFPQMDAALHHGGAGTTGASLRAGIPTLIKPWFGDQFFWASRVQRLGAGLRVPSLRSADLADALKKATTDRMMQEKAAAVGENIRQEDGVPAAIKAIYTYLDRAGKNRTMLEKAK